MAHLLNGWNILLKTFVFGILLGIAVAAGALYAVPVVDQYRETSIITVAPNGGSIESFHINIPVDRVMVGATGSTGVPQGLAWPKDAIFEDVSTEIFKIRNEKDAVIGVAARTVSKEDVAVGAEWVIHLPARGSLFVNMDSQVRNGGPRIGQLRAGSREFDDLNGFVAESWIENTSGSDGTPTGRIELLATYVSASSAPGVGELGRTE
jgi:hypothetical protein